VRMEGVEPPLAGF